MLYEIDGVPAFRIDLYDHSVARKWKNLINSIYVGDGDDLDHKRSFLDFATKQDVRDMLLESIRNINTFLKFEFIKIPDNLNWEDQEFFNTLHIAFEKLSGDFDNPTKLMQVAPKEIKESVRDLNYCVHKLEQDWLGKEQSFLNVHWTKNRQTTPRSRLEPNEYELIQFNRSKNEVYLAYNELGKSYFDLYTDGLSIDYEQTKNNHYVGADILVALSDRENIFDKDFVDWCAKHNVDAYDKRHGIGLLPIGKITQLQIDHLTKDSKINIIQERN